MLKLIQQENVEIDVAFWFIDDPAIGNALIKKIQSGVKVRMLVDPRSEDAHSGNTSILQEFATVTPPVPMRKRIAPSILHWKMMLFAGQGIVEFSGANFSQGEMVPAKNYVNYTDEAIFYTDDAAIVNSFRTMYDKWWVDTVSYADYAHTAPPFQLVPSYATYPIETEVCATVTGGCGMDFLPSSRTKDDYGVKSISAINAETKQLDIDMFRITNADITNATIAAFKRGVPVRMIVDASEYSNTDRVWVRYNVDRLFQAGIPLKITRHGGQNHEKSLLFYGQGLTVWGSSNWSAGSFNYGQEHNYFSTSAVKPWFFSWFQNHFERRWNSPQEYRAFVPIGPGPPVNKVPANGATGVSQSLSLRWDGGPWGQLFDIYLGTGATGPMTLIATNVATGDPDPAPNHVLGSYNISGLAPQTTYRWKIVSKTMANLTSAGPIWTFTTGGTAPTVGATVSSISPTTGDGNGGTAVTITGTSFASGAVVSFGVATASKIVVVNSTTITAVTPPHVAGPANVTVRNTAGDQGSLPNAFLYTSTPPSTLPQLNVIVPNSGTPAGGDSVTISGSNLTGSTVTIGGTPATIVSRSSVSITATTPAGVAGSPVDVVVSTPKGSATLKSAFTYADPPPQPSVSAISPSSGSMNGGTPIVISGTGFRYGAVVSFGGPPAPVGTGIEAVTMFVTNNASLCGSGVQLPCIVATTPPHAVGATDVVVTNMDPATGVIDSGSGSSAVSSGYSFVTAPWLSSVTPSSGTVSGGTTITINGSNFVSGAQVLVANQSAVVQSLTSTSITAVVPANSAQTATVSVVNPDGQSSNTLIYTYQ
ncbi:MAG TPA: IPT/TIG domain-containing protein [Terriglobales bacterium]|nr:IPT/TIG domain-containing protein [Terriglobales bacterium]